jgi:uncharacterized protein YqhQ
MEINQITAIVLIILLLVCSALLIQFRNTPFVKKYWRYALIIIPGLILIILKLLTMKTKKPGSTDVSTAITGIKDQLQEAKLTTAIEATAARTENKIKLEELKKVTQITDSQERRKRLAELMG